MFVKKKSYIVGTFSVKHANIVDKLTLTRCFNFAFLLFNLIQMKQTPFLFTLGRNFFKKAVSQISGIICKRLLVRQF